MASCYEVLRQHLRVDAFQVCISVKQSIEKRVNNGPLECGNCRVALTPANLIQLWLRTMQCARDGCGVDLTHGLNDEERLAASVKPSVAGGLDVVDRNGGMDP